MNIDTSDQYNPLDRGLTVKADGVASTGTAQCRAEQDTRVLDAIAQLLGGAEWDADVVADVASLVTSTGRVLADVDEAPDADVEQVVEQVVDALFLDALPQSHVALAAELAAASSAPPVQRYRVPTPSTAPPVTRTVMVDSVQLRREVGRGVAKIHWHLSGHETVHLLHVALAWQYATAPREAAEAIEADLIAVRAEIATMERRAAVMLAAAAWLRGA